jgi:aspartyl-tRNA(Asn)/glutamyl-tRNA(Gln) amidotransferase subunit A
VVGLKPTYDLVSRRGAYPLSYSLDHVGPIARTVEDAALAMNVIAGDETDGSENARHPARDYTSRLRHGLEGMSFGYARHYFAEQAGTSAEVMDALDGAAALLERLGASVEEVELPDFELFKACGRILMTAEAFAIHEADLKTRPEAFGRYMYQRVAPAALLSAADIIQAARLRGELSERLNREALGRHDMLLTAVAIRDAVHLDTFPRDWPPPADAVAVQTVPFNVSGNPALALPIGFSKAGLPLGLQLVGRYFGEVELLGAAAALEQELGVVEAWPSFPALPRETAAEVS